MADLKPPPFAFLFFIRLLYTAELYILFTGGLIMIRSCSLSPRDPCSIRLNRTLTTTVSPTCFPGMRLKINNPLIFPIFISSQILTKRCRCNFSLNIFFLVLLIHCITQLSTTASPVRIFLFFFKKN